VLDIGNNAESGQFILGQPLNQTNKRKTGRLQTAYELWPEVMDVSLEDDTEPSCSAAEALERQRPFLNQTLANHALALLSRLFRGETLSYHGGFVNLRCGSVTPLRVDARVWKQIRKRTHTR